MQRFDILENKIEANSMLNRDEMVKLCSKIDNVAQNDLKNLEDRTSKLEETINKLQLQNGEKFKKLETDFKVNINNMEVQNIDIVNQAKDLQDTIKSIERNKISSSFSQNYELEAVNINTFKSQSDIVSNEIPEEIKAKLKNEVLEMVNLKLTE